MARKALLIVSALILFCAAQALAQQRPGKAAAPLDNPPSSAAAHAQRRFSDFGHSWSAMPSTERLAFMEGYLVSLRLVCSQAAYDPSAKQNSQAYAKRVNDCLSGNFPAAPSAVLAAMNELYQQEANNHIPYGYMLQFALLKVSGKPYEDALAEGRKELDKSVQGQQ
jgi:hypothetical protein